MTGRCSKPPFDSEKRRTDSLRGRQGFLLALVFGTMAVLAIFFMVMSFLSSGQTHAATHFVDSARALSIAMAGAEWAISEYASGSYHEDDELGRILFGSALDPGEVVLSPPKELEDYVSGTLNGKLDVKVRVYDIAPLPIPEGLKGFNQDPVEKSGRMEFSSVGTVGKASRKVLIRKGFKVAMIVHPVLSKFTLFVREKLSGQDVNVLERKTGSAGFENGSPIVLNNQGSGRSFSVVQPDQTFDLSTVTGEKVKAGRVVDGFEDLVRSSGWVFLNSSNRSAPWTLNLSGSGETGEFDDRLLLRVGLYRNEGLEKLLAPKEKLDYTGERIVRLLERFQGMKSDYETRAPDGIVRKKPCNILYLRGLFPGDPPKASLIRPFGTGTRFSPTLMFGPVEMQYLILRGLDVHFRNAGPDGGKLFSNVLIPGFRNEIDFARAYEPRYPDDPDMGAFARLTNIPDRTDAAPEFPRYSRVMTTVATSPFIDALDYIFLESRERGTLLKPESVEYPVPVPGIIDRKGQEKILPWIARNDSLRDSLIEARGAFGMGKTPLFEGNLSDIKGCKEFQSKITAVFPSFSELEASFLEEKETSFQLRLPGIVYVGADNLNIEPRDKDLVITSPGIIVSGGDIHIKAAVKSSHPVTLVSLRSIFVETTEQIDAHLVCLMGTFTAPIGFDVRGGLAACSIDTSKIGNKEAKTITFVPEHDPYSDPDKWRMKTAYRFYLSQEEECCVEGGK